MTINIFMCTTLVITYQVHYDNLLYTLGDYHGDFDLHNINFDPSIFFLKNLDL